MNNDDILKLFEGLSAEQAKEMRRRIIPTLQALRREIVQERDTRAKPGLTKSRTGVGRTVVPAWLAKQANKKPTQRQIGNG
jgi:hypothetical protein